MLGPTLSCKEGFKTVEKPTEAVLAGMKYVALYFSAGFCGPCKKCAFGGRCAPRGAARAGAHLCSGPAPSRAGAPSLTAALPPPPQQPSLPNAPTVTPAFAVYYEDQGAAKDVEVVFVSADNEEDEFDEYFAEMPWTAVKYGFEGREAIGEKFGVVRARPPAAARARCKKSHPPLPLHTHTHMPAPRAGGHPARHRAQRGHGGSGGRRRARHDCGGQGVQGGRL